MSEYTLIQNHSAQYYLLEFTILKLQSTFIFQISTLSQHQNRINKFFYSSDVDQSSALTCYNVTRLKFIGFVQNG